MASIGRSEQPGAPDDLEEALRLHASLQRRRRPMPEEGEQTVYTCPMHPEVRQSEPGTCPTCGMELQPANE